MFEKGKPSWNKGLKGVTGHKKGLRHSIITKNKISETRKRLIREGKIIVAKTKGRTGMPHTEETKRKMRESNNRAWIKKGQTGKLCPAWKRDGAISPLYLRIRDSFKYRQWRSDVFTRDDFTCKKCGIKGGRLNVHHIKPFSLIMKENNIKTLEEAMNCEELWNINNGITFCEDCHKLTDNYLSNKKL